MKQPETTVLTIKQQRIALSGKKSKNRDQSGHSVFTSPYSPYWPVLGEDTEVDLNQLLIRLGGCVTAITLHIFCYIGNFTTCKNL
ncbi:hypothetical protein L798_12425 [Zootermopsis nevadensis]|uniref:Uncharacterized protein n=1 Tax=Zootermopsis nevadensis TaxID=136037 RepID=A0A067QUZ3_ZOONE|nr:hypothetical protein L798_12425 [Zootermopsis nevadensis]